MSKPTKTKSRVQYSKAELKAYEARRAEEVRRVAMTASAADAAGVAAPVRRSYALSRDEEYLIIRKDLRRLLMIVAVLMGVLILATLILR